MNRFDYVRPSSVAEAVALGSEPGSVYLAAGTNLVDLMKIGVSRPRRLVDIGRLPGLDRIEWQADGSLRIGALVRNADLAYDERFAGTSRWSRKPCCPARRPNSEMPRRPAATCSSAPAAPISRTPPATATGASRNPAATPAKARTATTQSWAGATTASRRTRRTSAFRSPPWMRWSRSKAPEGDATCRWRRSTACPATRPALETELAPGELVVAVRLPADAASFAAHARYVKLRERTSYAFALVSAAAALEMDDGRIVRARLALGSVAARPWRARAAEDGLAGLAPTSGTFGRAAEAALADARPSGENAEKIELARRVVVRALALAAAGTPQRMPALPGSPFSSPAGADHAA